LGVKSIVYLSLGANLGDRAATLRYALEGLRSLGTPTARSSFYETEPVEVAEQQPWYVNCVVAIETELAPEQLLARTQELERALGRQLAENELETLASISDVDRLLAGA